jgi:[ribosomal protein S18]-alanine N-acetyltransferase
MIKTRFYKEGWLNFSDRVHHMLRRLKSTDLPQLINIETVTQVSPWSDEIFNRCLMAGSIGWVVTCAETVVGFILILYQAGDVHILNLCIHPTYQHQGFGYKLLSHALEALQEQGATSVYLEVRCSNTAAIGLYKKLGFSQIGMRKDYYTNANQKEDALVFAKNLSAE